MSTLNEGLRLFITVFIPHTDLFKSIMEVDVSVKKKKNNMIIQDLAKKIFCFFIFVK